MASGTPVSERQLPSTVVLSTDLFGPAYLELNDVLTIVNNDRSIWRTAVPHILGKILVWVGTAKLLRTQFSEDPDGLTIHLAQAAPNGITPTALYLKPGTLEYLHWITNEGPADVGLNETPNGSRQDFHSKLPILSADSILFTVDGLILEGSQVTLPDGPGTNRMHLSFAPDTGSVVDWSYTWHFNE